MKNTRPSRRNVFLAATVLALLLLMVADYFFYHRKVYPGVYLYGVDVGGLTTAEARQLVQNNLDSKNFSGFRVFFHHGGQTWSFTCMELGLEVDWQDTLARAFAVGRERLPMLNYPARLRLLLHPKEVPLSFVTSEEKVHLALLPVAQALDKEPQEASFVLAADGVKVEIIPEHPGSRLDSQETSQLLEEAMQSYPDVAPVALAVREILPAVKAADLQNLRVRAEMAFFSTYFLLSLPGRVHNIRLAASAIDGTLLKPGVEFSFNAATGRTGVAQGYRLAPVIVAGEIVEGVGGGVCQVSSTLYNAMLLAGLKVVERANHSLAVSYVPPGRDAAVVYGWRDLRFLNNLDHGVWIRTFIEGNRLAIRLYGDPVPGREVKILTTDLETIPRGINFTQTDQLPAGTKEEVKKGQDGYRVTVWRVTSLNGLEISREMISSDFYKPVPGQFRVGTGPRPVH
ncbi:MAG: VanW family protein [Firmicutes bacterium]|nr:VanW family protein [Bacillota bacterium]